MPRWVKRGMDASAIKAADAKVRETVEGILAQADAMIEASPRPARPPSRRRSSCGSCRGP